MNTPAQNRRRFFSWPLALVAGGAFMASSVQGIARSSHRGVAAHRQARH